VKTLFSTLLLVGLMAYSASAQETKNEVGFLLGSEQIPGSTTTAGAPLSVGGSVAFSFDYARRLKGEADCVICRDPVCRCAQPPWRVLPAWNSDQPGHLVCRSIPAIASLR
jgi:hypothetical protein